MNEARDVKLSSRTVLFTSYLAALMVLAAYLLATHETALGYVIAGLAFLSIPPAMRHSIGDLAVGGGLKGALKVLTTPAKPGEPGSAP